MRVALFVTCLADHYFAAAAADAVRLLRHLGCEVAFPADQTCCGQPAYNAGRLGEARRMAEHTLEVFAGAPGDPGDPAAPDAPTAAEAVVLPSGSCATMVKKFYPRLLAGGADTSGSVALANRTSAAAALADRTFDLAEFIVHRLGVTELGSGLAGRKVAVHQGCHALRELRLETEPAVLLEGAGAEVVSWEAQEECCGFGGLFSVKMSAVSAAMADRKLDTLPEVDWVVSGDGGCVLHLDGRNRARGTGIEFVHLATALWRGVAGGARAAEGSDVAATHAAAARPLEVP
ncbi:MAG: (Fe-S)-binding protein [Gemmatimonadota bacterium]|nr:(Fe-S)-binding protein [Gemmatimonadota bacterium]